MLLLVHTPILLSRYDSVWNDEEEDEEVAAESYFMEIVDEKEE